MLRGLGGDGGKIMALGYDERDELETTRDRAEQTLLGVSQRLRGVNFVPMRTVVQQFFDAGPVRRRGTAQIRAHGLTKDLL